VAEALENKDDRASDATRESTRLAAVADRSEPQPTMREDVTEAEMESAIVRAMLEGRGAVAEMLTAALRARREASAGNVVELARRRR
jgi:hypothetical protein